MRHNMLQSPEMAEFHRFVERRCTQYNATLLPKACTLVSGGCCMVPECRDTDGSTFDPIANPPRGMIPIVAQKPGGFTGVRPAILPGQNGVMTGQRDFCVYKTQTYVEGDTWQDGCEYNCQCEDGTLGLYTCRAQCPLYENLSSMCRVTAPAPGQCCGDLQCDPFPTTPTPVNQSPSTSPGLSSAPTTPAAYDPLCNDRLSNCKAYERSSCQGIYEAWARNNCNLTCGYCSMYCP
ncbi:collagen alpha-4(vi) chain [Plakobranchus ocellatus]|uniref:Collagen alpha-4(Vi) chain n=1 Tax=Plakobranchus ocellatus TaxID=259542 RepID=A0AAV4BWP5_9GAST|nr:collagen alpha-4(vi) chain [Plakobranchus ocellatus]